MVQPLSVRHNGEAWFIERGSSLIAEIRPDHHKQVKTVVFCGHPSSRDEMSVLRLAASHVRQFVWRRTTSNGIFTAEHRDPKVTAHDAYRLMDFEKIPADVATFGVRKIKQGLHELGVKIVMARYETVWEALDEAMRRLKIKSLTYKTITLRFEYDTIGVRFDVKKPYRFTFWNSTNEEYSIIPPYHPEVLGHTSVSALNGATDYHIQGDTIRHVCSPPASRSLKKKSLSSTWNNMRHPFYATGRSLGITVDRVHMRTEEGLRELVRFLRGALSLQQKYVTVISGFTAPLPTMFSRLRELNRESPWPEASNTRGGHIARGCENSCVWQYRTLEAEGQLQGSRIPSWFTPEGWLDIYDGVEIDHGI